MTFAELAREWRPLLLLLASDKDGEVCAAARQLCKRLARHGFDLHDLADALEGAGKVAELRRPSGAATCWQDVAEFLADQADELSPRDREFVQSMRDLIRRGWTPTHKQAAWLRGLFARAGGCWAEEAA